MSRNPSFSMYRHESVRVKKVKPGLYRVCDMHGQASQYLTTGQIPHPVRRLADKDGIAVAEGVCRDSGRWTVRSSRKQESTEAQQ